MTPAEAVSRMAPVIAKSGYDGSEHDRGRVIAYTDRPTFTIQREDGTQFSWIADLCEVTP